MYSALFCGLSQFVTNLWQSVRICYGYSIVKLTCLKRVKSNYCIVLLMHAFIVCIQLYPWLLLTLKQLNRLYRSMVSFTGSIEYDWDGFYVSNYVFGHSNTEP